ncbi:uncharacterized protein LOC125480115 isoform X1 [Pyrus x bretschneideri]|uniref:uncharacterized protein LOC125480115 isoform X1 n=1 Tax=Pyrus x bretschneideri TaxID=225117 RepID=UPI00202E537B|nr:uncharacterized protein LOC125480115 isoform X1 [Pyrus x bretschneideri]
MTKLQLSMLINGLDIGVEFTHLHLCHLQYLSQFKFAMNSNFGSSSHSNWGSLSNSELEDKLTQTKQEDEESDEEDEAWCNTTYMAVRAGVMACEETEEQPQWDGSVAGHSYKPRNREMAHETLTNNYFNSNSVYIEEDFRRHFRMRLHVFERLLHDAQHGNPYFLQKKDKAGHAGFSTYQKVTIALQMLAYASPADAMNDTYGMFESTCLDNLAEFCHTVVQIYKEEYLGEPNQADLARLFRKVEDRGFLGMIRSLDCMH